jgi:hypothetical protein
VNYSPTYGNDYVSAKQDRGGETRIYDIKRDEHRHKYNGEVITSKSELETSLFRKIAINEQSRTNYEGNTMDEGV